MTINLIAQATQAAQDLANKLKEDTLELTVQQLAQVLPEASVFGEDTVVIQLYRTQGQVRGSTVRVWQEDGEPIVLDAALNPITADIQFNSWQAKGYTGSAIVAAGEQEFVIELGLDLNDPTDPIGGEGAPDPGILKARPIRAIAFKALDTGVTYKVTERDDQFATIETPEGEDRYYLSGRLKTLIDQEGGKLPFEFEITGWETLDIDGQAVQAPIVKKAQSADFSAVL